MRPEVVVQLWSQAIADAIEQSRPTELVFAELIEEAVLNNVADLVERVTPRPLKCCSERMVEVRDATEG